MKRKHAENARAAAAEEEEQEMDVRLDRWLVHQNRHKWPKRSIVPIPEKRISIDKEGAKTIKATYVKWTGDKKNRIWVV